MHEDFLTRLNRMLLRVGAAPAAKRMVIMIGPPASGKGHFIGEPDDDAGLSPEERKRKSRSGWNLPASTGGLFRDGDIPEITEHEESDGDLKKLQQLEVHQHYRTLLAAHRKGKDAFDAELKREKESSPGKNDGEGYWYDTKDGKRVKLSDVVTFENFPSGTGADGDPKAFSKLTTSRFYGSMRGRHNEATWKGKDGKPLLNKTSGKQHESLKEQARDQHHEDVRQATNSDDAKNGFYILDAAGEDIDVQDFPGQIEAAKRNGYEVSVFFLHPDKGDTELSNMARNAVGDKREVDQIDVDNWYENNKKALDQIIAAAPHNFVHMRKSPPHGDPAVANAIRQRAKGLMGQIRAYKAEIDKKVDAEIKESGREVTSEEREKMIKAARKKHDNLRAASAEVGTALYTNPYTIVPETSYGTTLQPYKGPDGKERKLNRKLKAKVSDVVKQINRDGARRAKVAPHPAALEQPITKDKIQDTGHGAKFPAKPKDKPAEEKVQKKEPAEKEPAAGPAGKPEPTPAKEPEATPEQEGKPAGGRAPRPEPGTYGFYVERKKREGKPPLPKRDWERRVKSRTACMVERVASLWEEYGMKTAAPKGTSTMDMNQWQDHLVKVMKQALKGYKDYPAVVKAGAGPRNFVVLQGAEGDTTAARRVRELLTKTLESEIGLYDDEIKLSITSLNQGDDLVVKCEFVLP